MEDINAQILLEGFGKKMINSFRIRTGLICQTEGDIYEWISLCLADGAKCRRTAIFYMGWKLLHINEVPRTNTD